jgi:iron complex outermembrane receptor protein
VPITDQLQVIGGARITRDDITSTYFVSPTPGVCLRAAPGPAQAILGNCVQTPRPPFVGLNPKRTDWSGKIGLQFDINDDVMTYASCARGYKGPKVNNVNGASTLVRPETSDNYEIGLKAQLFDRNMTLNLAAYHSTYKDFQAQTLVVINGTNQYSSGNAGQLRIKGIELESVMLVTEGLKVSANVAYNDSEFLDFITTCYPGQTAALGCQPAVAATPTTAAIPARFQAAGFPLNNAPKWTYSAAINYERPITDSLKLDASVNMTYKSDVFFTVGDRKTVQPGYSIVNATLGFGAEDDKWRVGVFARNLFDQNYVVQIAPNIGDNRTGAGLVVGYHNRPTENANRTLGVSVDFKF